MARVSIALLLPLLVAVLGGCAYKAPTVLVGEAAAGERTDEALRIEIAVNATNPNREPVELREIEYSVSIDGSTVFRGRRAAQTTLGAGRTRQLLVPAVVRFDQVAWGDAVPSDATWSIRGRMLYLTPSELAEILLDTGIRKPRVRFAGRGRVALAPSE
jgi:hypothetical protein